MLDPYAENVVPFRGAPHSESMGYLRSLSAQLSARVPELAKFDAYYRGDQGLRFAHPNQKELFAKLFEGYAENYCGLVVDAVEERLDVEGFTFPTADDPVGEADKDAWRIWQDNQLDAASQIAHTEALVKGLVYVLVDPFAQNRIGPDKRSPKITIEDPCQTIIEYAPGSRERLVAMKRWQENKRTYATLYYPDRIEKWQSTGAQSWQDDTGRWRDALGRYVSTISGAWEQTNWEQRVVPDELWPLQNPLGIVPIVPLFNRPRLVGDGESEIAGIIPIQNAINKLAMDMLIASNAGAFPQKYASGIEIPIDKETGKPDPNWQPDIERIISTPVPDAKFGTFEATDLRNFVVALDQKVQSIASTTRTPYHYFLRQGGQPPSGESLKSSETGLVKKVERKQRHFGEGWEEVIRLAFRSLEDPRSEVLDSETEWANPESVTESEHIDALIKRRGLRVPFRQIWKDMGYSPTQIESFPALLLAEKAWLDETLAERDALAGKAVVEPAAAVGPEPPVEPTPPAPRRRSIQRDAQGRVAAIVDE